MDIRPYTPEDFPAVASWVDGARTHGLWCAGKLPYPFTAEGFHRFLRQNEAARGDTSRVMTDGDAPAGFFCLAADRLSHCAALRFVLLAPERRGRGEGLAMVRLALAEAFADRAVNAVELHVFAENSAARRCYEQAGFALSGPAEPDAVRWRDWRWTRLTMEAVRPRK